MQKYTGICLIVSILLSMNTLNGSSQNTLSLMPVPAEIVLKDGIFRLDESFALKIDGPADSRLYRASTGMLRRLAGRTGYFLPQDYITASSNPENPQLVVKISRIGDLKLFEDESYSLTITDKKITLIAETDIGALRGFETFLQLLSIDKDGYYLPNCVINDKPRFPWRGLMIDASRHFMPVDVIKRNLDGMAAVKLNVFHWHLADDQGFRVECKTWPKLHELGSDGFYYTQNQINDIIKYAANRGIRVIPEFDVPAHATSWLTAYPELASAPGPYTVERGWGVKDPTINPVNEFTYEFLDKFFAEMATLFPDDYIHIGGDENNGKHWNANPEIQQFMKENNIPDNHMLQAYFNKRVLKILTKYNKKMIGWDEIFQPGLPNNIVIHSWRGQKSLIESAQKGYMGILSNGYYIDLIQPAEYHYLNDPIPAKTPLSTEEQKKILGGEATSWAELVTYETVDSRIWPRTAAIAERFWSPQFVKNVDDMYRRLEVVSFHLDELGLLHIKNYEMMLRRLTNNHDISALKTFVDVVEPVKIYTRHRQGKKYLQQSPYTRVVDAARPESITARHFSKLVDQYIVDPKNPDAAELILQLSVWQENHRQLVEIIKVSPVLKEIEGMSADLEALANLGLEAAKALAKNKTLKKNVLQGSETLFENASKPRGQVELMIVPSIHKLVAAASN